METARERSGILFSLPGLRRKTPTSPVTVLIAMADPIARRAMRQTISRALTAVIVEADSKPYFQHAVGEQEIDLIVADADLGGSESIDTVEQIRYGRLHCHAFPLVVILSDHPTPSSTLRIIDSGADLVLPADAACRVLPDHLVRLTQTRKPFVVAPHYIGPERREAPRQQGRPTEQLDVPNPLAARANAMPELEYRRLVSVATHAISLMRRGLYAVRVNQPIASSASRSVTTR